MEVVCAKKVYEKTFKNIHPKISYIVLRASVLNTRACANREYKFVVYVLFCSKTKGKMLCLFSEF